MDHVINVILVDDEIKALTMLESKLRIMFPSINIAGKFDDPEEAIEGINNLKCDLLFLDINMPGYTGFDILKHIYEPQFELIFITAYDNYALEAIKHAAIGYVLKPINDADLREAGLRALEQIQLKRVHSKEKIEKISIPFSNGFALKSIKDIIRLEGLEGYTKIILVNETITSSYNIGLFNKMLSAANFRMVHKSHLINIEYVDKYMNEGTIVLSNGDHVPVSRSNKAEIINFFKNNH